MSKAATFQASMDPPDHLEENQLIARVTALRGSSLFEVTDPAGSTLLVEMPPKFRKSVWVKRGGYVLLDKSEFQDKKNKIDGTIVHVIHSTKVWMKQHYWPPEFAARIQPVEEDESSSSEEFSD
ncbi:translation initiation factor eIF1A-like protein [Schizosaccharomyces japonicus yFS275]|uniref:Translation initiation factor eIF1A-like protein n=1 Tax=Schizosaccharomyces japonicus (strain yFS275 / FY16936) TaxID=402676 RepID=B6K5M0_SCHJY|nr:translation initiation factor eIF1A-like protein [Schizosaccharomyces japonicus yFS275]EEB08824.1 translation initiation factor eIF1A-like protein [Schizosaccharomyces japonicus yFS275]